MELEISKSCERRGPGPSTCMLKIGKEIVWIEIQVKVVWSSYTRDAKGCQEMDDIVDSEFECPIFGDKAGHCGETGVVVE